MKSVAVIIVTYNAMPWAEKCFSSMKNSSIPVQTFVVDNGSTDGTQEFIKSHFPEVNFTQSKENLGFGKANNLGIEKAYVWGANFFYLMNQDAWMEENTISQLLEIYDAHTEKEELGIISPMQIDGTGKKLDIFLDKYIAQNFQNRLISDLYFQNINSLYELQFVNAAHWFIPKATIEVVGGFNPYFFHYGEDNEYVNRVHYHGKKVFLAPKVKVVHDGKQALGKVDYNKFQNTNIQTKMMNPAMDLGIFELKQVRNSSLKNLLIGNLAESNKLHRQYKSLKKESSTLMSLRNKVKKKGPTFLNINF